MTRRIAEIGGRGFAITDHGVLSGFSEISRAGKKNGITAVPGVEFYIAIRGHEDRSERDSAHLTVWAYSLEGYRNLCRLHSISFQRGYYFDPRIDLDLLHSHSNGLMAATGCLSGLIMKPLVKGDVKEAESRLRSLKEIFGKDRVWVEIQDHGIPEEVAQHDQLRRLSKKFDLPMLATADSHYVEKGDWIPHDALICLGKGQVIGDPKNAIAYRAEQFHLKTEAEMLKVHDKAHVHESGRIFDMIEPIDITSKTFHIPQVVKNADRMLRDKAWAGICERYDNPKTLKKRFEYEYEAVVGGGFTNYLLIIADLYDFARSKDIPAGAGRGSAAGSLICYGLGITNIDPILYDLSFDRFIDRNRVSQPDIDADFSAARADELMDYLREKWGADNVANIITFQTMGGRGAIRDCARVLCKPLELSDRLAKMVPLDGSVTRDREERHYIADALKNVKDFKALYDENDSAREIIDLAMSLEGTPKSNSFHAAGVVIADKPLSEYCPMICLKEDKESKVRTYATAYGMNDLEEIGLLKIDVLKIKTLDVMADCIASAKAAGEMRPDFASNEIPLDDPAAYALLAKGNTGGVFQVESSGLTGWLRKLQPENIHDIAVMLSLFRPGPMSQIPSYIDRKHGKEAIDYPHPSLEPILASTFGKCIYQEQIIAVAIALAGWTFTRADQLRSVIGKKKVEKMPQEKAEFIEGAVSQGHSREWATALFESFIEPSSKYSFGKSHAYSYADLTVKTAWLKAAYPVHYFAALLKSVSGDVERTAGYVLEAKTLGVNVLPPDINESGTEFTVTGRGITYGLPAVKNAGGKACAIITKRRKSGPYTDLFDFIARTKDRLITTRTVESLVKAGALDNLPGTRYEKLASIDVAFDRLKMIEEDEKRAAEGRPPVKRKKPIPEPVLLEPSDEILKTNLLAAEREMVGTYISGHPFKDFAEAAKTASTHSLYEVRTLDDRAKATICGICTNLREHTVKRSGAKMLFASIEDAEVSLDVTVFPKAYDRCRGAFELDKPVVLSGVVSVDEVEGSEVSQVKFFVDSAVSLEEAAPMRRKAPQNGHKGARIGSQAILGYEGYLDSLDRIVRASEGLESPYTITLPSNEVWEVS